MNPILALSLAAGLLAVDDRAGWQSLLAQPVFAALAVGLIIGEMQAALAVGVALELIWLSILPMRGLRRPDQIAGAVVGAGTASLLIRLTADPRFMFVVAVGLFVGLVAGEVAARLSAPLLALQDRKLSRVSFDGAVGHGATMQRISLLHLGSLVFIFATEFVIAFILLGSGFRLAEWFTRYVGGSIVSGIVYWEMLTPALGVAALIHLYWHGYLKRVLVLSTVMVTLVLWLQ